MKRARVLFVAGALVLGAASGCGSDKPKASPTPSTVSASPAASTPPPVSPSPSVSGGQVFPSEYTVQGASVCAWEKKGGVIRLGATFGISYSGTAPAGDVSYTVTEDHSNASE